MSGDFEIIDASEFEAATAPKPRVTKSKTTTDEQTLERTRTNWFHVLNTQLGECSMPSHDEVMESMNKLEQEYRRRYPVRMVLKRDDETYICRDCWQRGY